MASDKALLRQRMRAWRAALSSEQRLQGSAAATKRVLSYAAYQAAQVVCAYASLGDELDTSSLRAAIAADGKILLLPRVEHDATLSLRAVGDDELLEENRYGILEPAATAPRLEPSAVDLFVVPGLAFDAQGGRLGYGGGYYDRLLAQARLGACIMGLAFDGQLVAQLPQEPFDVRMNIIVTEARSLHPPL